MSSTALAVVPRSGIQIVQLVTRSDYSFRWRMVAYYGNIYHSSDLTISLRESLADRRTAGQKAYAWTLDRARYYGVWLHLLGAHRPKTTGKLPSIWVED